MVPEHPSEHGVSGQDKKARPELAMQRPGEEEGPTGFVFFPEGSKALPLYLKGKRTT